MINSFHFSLIPLSFSPLIPLSLSHRYNFYMVCI